MQKEEFKNEIISVLKGNTMLNTAFIGIASGLFSALSESGKATAEELSRTANTDSGYTVRWCDAAFAVELLDEKDGVFSLSEKGSWFLKDAPGTFGAMPVQSVLGTHMAERIAGLIRTGEIVGEKILGERPSVLPLFGFMLEKSFQPLFEGKILSEIRLYSELNEKGGTVLDLGCGNGWYLTSILKKYPNLKGIGIDGFSENITEAEKIAQSNGLSSRLAFESGDIFDYKPDAPVQAIAMNRALHHVWDRKETVFRKFAEMLAPGGGAVIWEPRWPDSRQELRSPAKRMMAFQNMGEHAQGNHFLTPAEIEEQFRSVGMKAETSLFMDGNEAVVTGIKA